MSCPFATASQAQTSQTSAEPQNKEIPIPQPSPSWLTGNFSNIDPEWTSRSLQQLAEIYGEIYQLDLGKRMVVLSSQKLINEACDQERFHKEVNRTYNEVRALTGDGLFTSQHEDGLHMKAEKNWWKAHRLLMPAFGPLGIRKMFDDMVDISSQMILRWDRSGPQHAIECSDDFTRLAFDTIGLCSFGYRFNEFYSDHKHEFADQMSNVLKIAGRRAARTDIQNKLHYWEHQEEISMVEQMHALAKQIVAERRAHPDPDAKDLLNTMLHGIDRETGESLDEQNVIYNMVTFLVAGHETTSATLSFMWYNLLKNPDKFLKAQHEVDTVVGDKIVTLDMLPKLPYIDACVKETLRLNSPIQAPTVVPRMETYLDNGKYKVGPNDLIPLNLKALHHDPLVWGDDHNDFTPERFLDGKFQKLPPNSFKAFGNGLRACIGRAFAEQEMIINTAMILQKFTPEMVDPSYTLRIKSTLTIKPDGFFMRVKRRAGVTSLTGIPGGIGDQIKHVSHPTTTDQSEPGQKSSQKIHIYHGGNSGTCEGLAEKLHEDLSYHGIASKIDSLDSATQHLDADAMNYIIAASFEGKPADNSKRFVTWLESLEDKKALSGINYSVLGMGNPDWASTFHRIPRLIDELMSKNGAKPIVPAAYTNVKTDLLGPFEEWSERIIQSVVGGDQAVTKKALSVTLDAKPAPTGQGEESIGIGTVLENRELADTSVGAAKRHIVVQLPAGMTYTAGDYLVIQPQNPEGAVRRVMRRFALASAARFSVQASKKKFLPSEPTLVVEFLRSQVELGTPITKRQVEIIISHATDQASKEALTKIVQNEDRWNEIQSKRFTPIDILEENPNVNLPFAVYLDMLLPLAARQYSISSSPLASPGGTTASITYDVHSSPALSGHGVFEGVASTYLASREVGDTIYCLVRATNQNFRLPSNPETPVVLFAAGTGIAPMRAFMEERAIIATAGREQKKFGPMLLFFGCRDPDSDQLYKNEIAEWEKLGVVKAYYAYSRAANTARKYVPEVIYEQKEEVRELFSKGAKLFLCGSASRLGQGCADTCKKIWLERHEGSTQKEADEWLDSIKTDRYISDVY